MKKLFLITLLSLFSIGTIFAQSGTVEVFSEEGDKFWVIVNGVKQNAKPMVNVKMPGIKEQWFKMRVIFENETIPNLDQTVQMVGVDNQWMDVTYSIKKNNKGKYVIRQSAWKESADQGNGNTVVQTPAQTSPSPSPTPKTTPATTTTTTKTTTTNTASPNGINMAVKDEEMGVNFNMNVNVDGMNMNGNSTTTTTTTKSTTSSSSSSFDDEPAASPAPAKSTGCMSPMNSLDFENAKKSISSKGFEEDKLKIAKQIIKSNCLNTTQVKTVMKLFGFEESKLDFAKAAYSRTTDKNNYYTVNDAFGFSQSIEELDQFINNQ